MLSMEFLRRESSAFLPCFPFPTFLSRHLSRVENAAIEGGFSANLNLESLPEPMLKGGDSRKIFILIFFSPLYLLYVVAP